MGIVKTAGSGVSNKKPWYLYVKPAAPQVARDLIETNPGRGPVQHHVVFILSVYYFAF